MKIKALVLVVLGLTIGSQMFSAPNIKGQAEYLKQAPKSAMAITDKNVKYIGKDNGSDIFQITLKTGETYIYICNEGASGSEVLISVIERYGVPKYISSNNTELDKHVAKVTKLYGYSIGVIAPGIFVLNIYDPETNVFVFYQW